MEGIVATPEVAGRSRRHTSVNIPCGHRTFHQLFMHPRDLLSTFHAAAGPSINFLCIHRTFHGLSVHPSDHPSTFREAAGSFVNFRQLSVLVQDRSSVSGASRGFSSKYCCYNGIFVHFQCATRPSCNFWCGGGNFHQFPVWRQHFPSTSCAEAVLQCGDGTFRHFTGWQRHFHQFLVRPRDLP